MTIENGKSHLTEGEDANIDNIGDGNEHDRSPEAAGAARGLSQTARAVAKRGAVGRLPQEAAKASSKAAAKTSAGAASRAGRVAARRGGPRPAPSSAAKSAARSAARRSRAARGGGRVPVRRVARTTDRISTGLDVVSTVSEQEDVPSAVRRRKWRELGRKAAVWAGTLVKNTVLGAAVFGTYEVGVEKLASFDDSSGRQIDISKTIPVPGHFAMGAFAGLVHAVLSPLADSTVSSVRHASLSPLLKTTITSSYVLHHTIAHSVLFGSYEMTKRILLEAVESSSHNSKGNESVSLFYHAGAQHGNNAAMHEENLDEADYLNKDESEEVSVRYSHLLAIGTAGGIAGSIQHVISHFTEHWLGLAGGWEAVENCPGDNSDHERRRSGASTLGKELKVTKTPPTRLRWYQALPALRPTALAFFPSAIGFMAFEYGKDVVAY
mmetsp:Transcript_34456/g.63683  ORF Transcript_34456/g.63683 Transcript_34456/m.63683 type:complete len:438 (-) Transcript_34456:40-1353(-)